MIEEIRKACPSFRGVCPNPVFIIGSPRSGTTALACSLAQHSQLWTAAESDFLFHLFSGQHAQRAYQQATNVSGDRWLNAGEVGRNEFLAYLGLGLNALFTSRSGGRRWIDQTPLYTLISDALAELFPGAYFIHILRDGRRVVNSMTNFLQSPGIKAAEIPAAFIGSWTTDFRKACQVWSQYVDAAMQFQEGHRGRCITVRNENLLENPRDSFKSIFDVIGVPFEDGPPTFFSTHRINSSFQRNSVERLSSANFPNPWESWTLQQRMIFLSEAGATTLKYEFASADDLYVTEKAAYHALVARIREVVQANLPPACTIAVVSKGDDELLKLHGRTAWHLPRGDDGLYTGHHPADSDEAVGHLEALRVCGADYLLIPETSLWWLDHYGGFRNHLEARYRCIWSDASCRLFFIHERRDSSPAVVATVTSTVTAESFDSLGPDGFPLPPQKLHTLISGNALLGESDYLMIGNSCADNIRATLNRSGIELEETESILDFGCGAGRIIRHFHNLSNAKLYGTDIDQTLVEWCSRSLPFATFSKNSASPPLPFSNDFFGFIYAFSVFTHLGLSQQIAWLNELGRVLRPESHVLITAHGEAFLQKLREEDRTRFRAGELIVYNEHAAGVPSIYGTCNAFHPVEYIRQGLAPACGFAVLNFSPGRIIDAPRGRFGQDNYLLKKSIPVAGLWAVPNPVPTRTNRGKTTIFWSTGTASVGQVYVSENGRIEDLFADNCTCGAKEVSWIGGHSNTVFRLYAGLCREKLLASVEVGSGEISCGERPQ